MKITFKKQEPSKKYSICSFAVYKIVKNEFLAVEDISNINDGKLRYETREHGGINGLTPSEMFLQRLIKSDT